MTAEAKKLGYFGRLLDEIRARNLPVPPALIGEARPLALSTREDLQPWAELHGYDEAALHLLNQAVGVHVRSHAYKRSLMVDLAERVDLDGRAVGYVSELDRHSAAFGGVCNVPQGGAAGQ